MGCGGPAVGRCLAGLVTVGDAVHRDVFNCRLDDQPARVLGALQPGQDDCIVLNAQGIVMGRTRRRALQQAQPDAPMADVVELGPTTVRPDELLDRVAERMRRRGVSNLVVATYEGRLVGILHLDDAEKLLGIESSEIERD